MEGIIRCGFVSDDDSCAGNVVPIEKVNISRNSLIWRYLQKRPTEEELQSKNFDMICEYHKRVYLYKFESNRKQYCFDPMQLHSYRVKSRIVNVSEEEAILINDQQPKRKMVPGYGICHKCKATYAANVINQPYHDEESLLSSQESINSLSNPSFSQEFQIPKYEVFLKMFEACYKEIKKLPEGTHHGDERRVKEGLKLLQKLQVQGEELLEKKTVDKCQDCKMNMEIIKEAIPLAKTRNEVVRLTSLAPSTWKCEEVCEELQIGPGTLRAARMVRRAKKSFHIMKHSSKNSLSKEVEEKVDNFFKDSDVSVASPSATVQVKDPVTKEKTVLPKYLMLKTIDQTYVEFKEKFPNLKVGRSSFHRLRPVNVCVPNEKDISCCLCLTHSNMDLLLQPMNMSHNDALSLVVCDPTSKDCMNMTCTQCPGVETLREYLIGLIDLETTDFIHYQEWIYQDKFASIQATKMDSPTYIDIVIERFPTFMRHHYIYKSQKSYFEYCKQNVIPENPIILTDFGENYSFVVRDQIQGFFFNQSTPCTICPFVCYFKEHADDEVKHQSFLIISDTHLHDTYSFHVFRCKVLEQLKEKYPHFKKISYFSDGCSGQYKNFKNFALLCRHNEEFNLEANWHFFATSHGKNACDSICGVVKKQARMYSLKNAYGKQIQTPWDLYEFCINNLKSIVTIFVHDDDVKDAKSKLDSYFVQFKGIKGTQKFHSFSPVSLDTIKTANVSDDQDTSETKFNKKNVIVKYSHDD